MRKFWIWATGHLEVAAMTASWPFKALDWLADRFADDEQLERIVLRFLRFVAPGEHRKLLAELQQIDYEGPA